MLRLPCGDPSCICVSFLIRAAAIFSLFVTGLVTYPVVSRAQQSPSNIDELVDRIVAREHQEIILIRQYSPIVETYIQEMRPDKEFGVVPSKDHYFLGLADFRTSITEHSLLEKSNGSADKLNPSWPFFHFADLFSTEYDPQGFLEMIFIDPHGFDRAHYRFEYVRREFLGEARCLVFDVTPLPRSGKFRFKGRIWADERDFTIVRFNGVFTPVQSAGGLNVHFDSWRTNLQSGIWLPSYVFSQESGLKGGLGTTVRFKSQTRLWGYSLKNAAHETEFSELKIEAPGAIQDQAEATRDPSPIEAERLWQREAEDNVLERLQRTGFLAPPGPVDKVLATVVNNLEVSNNIDIQPEIRCRVLLTATLESFSIGHTIVLSRGLLDVLPDEASLAAMLAQEMATIMVTKRSSDPWGFNDLTNVAPTEVVARFAFRATPEERKLASQQALTLLNASPYKDKLKSAGLFLKQLDVEQKALPSLINPMLGDRVVLAQQLIDSAPQLQASNLDQISALPLGGRLKLDPWTDKVEMYKPKAVALNSVQEKIPFEVTPFVPYLTYYAPPGVEPQAVAPSSADVAKARVQPAPSTISPP